MKNHSTILILQALINGADDITANNGLKYHTTRVSNIIVKLRDSGLLIETVRVDTNNSWYGRYTLVNTKENRLKAIETLKSISPTKTADTKGSKTNRNSDNKGLDSLLL
jgi:transcription initiation factor IIE alpha subunit